MGSAARRRIGLLFVSLGAVGSAVAVWGLWRDVAWIAQPFYAYAWWSYILVLDGFCALRRGHSLFTSRWRCVPAMAICSITFWFFFELLNLRFKNWYYVGVFAAESILDLLGGGIFVVLCFSTVFIGIFQTYEALTAVGLFKNWRGRREENGRLPGWVSYAVQALGLGMAAAAMLWPYYLAPLVWGSFTFIVDPWNYRRGTRSILRDFETRNWGLIARFFAAGLVCGLVWESFNFFAPQKWIYTVRGLEGFKLFEMPLLGFLGFPALAFDSLAGFALLSSFFHGNETWEDPGDLGYELRHRPRPPRWAFAATLPLQLLFWAAVSELMVGVNFGSLELELNDLGLSPAESRALGDHGVRRPRQLLRLDPDQRSQLERDLSWDEERLGEILDRARLYSFKGIGYEFGALLERVGVESVDDLRRHARIEDLHSALRREAARSGRRTPRLDWVRVWVLASRSGGIVLRE